MGGTRTPIRPAMVHILDIEPPLQIVGHALDRCKARTGKLRREYDTRWSMFNKRRRPKPWIMQKCNKLDYGLVSDRSRCPWLVSVRRTLFNTTGRVASRP